MKTRTFFLALILMASTTMPARGQHAPDDLVPLASSRLTELTEHLQRGVTLIRERARLEDLLHEIGRQSGTSIVFATDLVEGLSVDTINLIQTPAAEAILSILSGLPIEAFISEDGSVVIRPQREGVREPGGRDALRQTVRGTVIDRTLRMPLPGANVVVVGTDPLIGTTADVEGRFVLENVPLGRRDIRISFIGYETLTLPEVLVSAGKEVVLEVALAEQVVEGEEIVVHPNLRKDRPLNEMALVGARSFSVEETRRYAGGLDDPARMASVYAGVAAGAGIQENAVVIRGNAPKGVKWRLEGVEIPNPNHFAGMAMMGAGALTLFSSQLLADSDFFTSAFPADYGNAMAGVFDMNFRTGNPSRREHAVQIGLIGIDAASEGPIGRAGGSTYLFNYRYSTIGLIMPLLPTEDVARFQDLSFKLHFPLKGGSRLDVWGIGGLDGQTMSATDDSTEWEYETWDRMAMDLRLGVGAAGVGYSAVLGERSFLQTTVALSAGSTRLEQQRMSDRLVLADHTDIDELNARLTWSSSLNHRFGGRHVNRTGFSASGVLYDFELLAAVPEDAPLREVAAGSGRSALLQGYSQSRFDLTSDLVLNAGVHVMHFALTGATAVEPRVSTRWEVAQDQALSVGYGLHSQTDDLRIYLARVGDARPNIDLRLMRAHHGVVSYDVAIGRHSRVKAEGFVQRLFDVPVIADSSYSLLNFQQDFQFAEALVNRGAGLNYGLDVTAERFLKDGFYYLITASLLESRYRGGDGVWRPTRWDRGYMANGLVGREFVFGGGRSLLGVNLRASVLGGTRRSPVDAEASRRLEEVVFDERRAFAERGPGLFLVDVTLTYRRSRGRVADVWALQVKNALASKETILDYNFQTNEVDEVREGFPLPVLSYKLEF